MPNARSHLVPAESSGMTWEDAKPFEEIPGPSTLPVVAGLHHYLPYIGEWVDAFNDFTAAELPPHTLLISHHRPTIPYNPIPLSIIPPHTPSIPPHAPTTPSYNPTVPFPFLNI